MSKFTHFLLWMSENICVIYFEQFSCCLFQGAIVQSLIRIHSQEFISPVSEPLSCFPSHRFLFSPLSLPPSKIACLTLPPGFTFHFSFHVWKLPWLLQICLTFYGLLSAHMKVFWSPTLILYDVIIPVSGVLQDWFCCLSWLSDSHSSPLFPVVTGRGLFVCLFYFFIFVNCYL